MGVVGKCTSWLGHHFEPRYSKGPAVHGKVSFNQFYSDMEDVLERYRPVTYERDVCVRCGATVEKTLAGPVQKAS